MASSKFSLSKRLFMFLLYAVAYCLKNDCGRPYDLYRTCKQPLPSGCCVLSRLVVCDGTMLSTTDLPSAADVSSLVIANTISSSIIQGNWSFLIHLPNLEDLTFINSIEKLTMLRSEYFENMETLVTVSFASNNFSSFFQDKLPKLKSLKTLQLSCNTFMRYLTEEQWYLEDLEDLRIILSAIRVIKGSHFQGLNALRYLDLSKNRITTFSLEILQHLPKLEYLRLAYNNIVNIGGSDIVHDRIKIIDFSYNSIDFNTVLKFTYLSALEAVNLDSNSIGFIPTDFSIGSSEIRRLNLNNNSIQFLPPSLLAHFPNLEKISVGRNRQRSLAESTFRSSPKIARINLANNKIEYLPVRIFEHLHNLTIVDIIENRMQVFHADFFARLNTKVRLYPANNPIICNCSVIPLLRWLEKTKVDRDAFPRCHSPNSTKNQLINNIHLKQICSFKPIEPITDFSTTSLSSQNSNLIEVGHGQLPFLPATYMAHFVSACAFSALFCIMGIILVATRMA